MELGTEGTTTVAQGADWSECLVSATVWTEGRGPRGWDEVGSGATGVRWLDLAPSATVEKALDLLGPVCPGLEREMLVDLLARDDVPENRSWHDGTVRLASSFAVYSPEARDSGGLKPVFTSSAEAVYEAVELLAGEGWLITRWHEACLYRGAEPVEDGLPPASREDLRAAVAKRWVAGGARTAGELGVLAMHELALTYAPTHRRFRKALEEWELNLYGVEGQEQLSATDERRLRDLWGACARLRDWLNPLNVPGLRLDPDKAWLPEADHDEVIAVDERIDKALRALSELSNTLRSSFHLLHIQKSEEQRERNEQLQRRIEILAPIFVVPTLVVGFYGANTWVPGEHRQWGFWVMVAAIAVLTCITATVLWATSRRHREEMARRRGRPRP
jgi:hypothetical protein